MRLAHGVIFFYALVSHMRFRNSFRLGTVSTFDFASNVGKIRPKKLHAPKSLRYEVVIRQACNLTAAH